MSDQLNPEQRRRLDDCLASLAEGDLPHRDVAQLERLLVDNHEALWHYIQAIHLLSALRWQLADLSELASPSVEQQPCVKPRSISRGLIKQRSRDAWLAGAILLVVGCSTVLWMMLPASSPSENVQREVEATNSYVRAAQSDAFIAQITLVSPDCEWPNKKWELAPGSQLQSGQYVRITNGQVRLAFQQGAEVALSGPAVFVVKTVNSGTLILGGLTAQIPESASGFVVDMPNGQVTDLGTEFGLIVDDFGVTEVAVFEGKVLTQAKQSNTPYHLDAGQSLLWDIHSVKRSDVRPHRFDQGKSFTSFFDKDSDEKLILADDFSSEELNEEMWKTLGYASQSNGHFQLGRESGTVQGDNVPYLLSVRQFDPADGAVVVTGTVIFSDPLQPLSGSLSVFTRAEDERGSFPRLDYAHLATGVRSTFWPVSSAEGETLRVLVRPLPGSENIGILGEEFEASLDSSKWQFQVVDDGVNLTLSVAQVDNPSVMKTVRARSLFHGTKNFIALEGDPNAKILLDDIRIFQLEKKLDI